MKNIFIACLAMATLASTAVAQQTSTHQGQLHRTTAPIQGTYDMTTGFELGAPTYRAGPATIFDNTDGLSYYFSYMGATNFIGVGWMYLDAGLSGLSGPFLGSTITSAGPGTAVPGYGSQDQFELMELQIVGAEHQGTYFFGGFPKAQATFNIVMYGDGILDTDVIYADVPNVNDVLCLGSDVEFRTGNAVTWALDSFGGTAVFPSGAYAMLIGRRGNSAGFGTFAGSRTTLLVHPLSLLPAQSPLIMSGAVPAVTTPPLPGLPPTLWAQAFGFNGGIGQGNAAEASNALRHDN